jgi:acetylornithine deacetylase
VIEAIAEIGEKRMKEVHIPLFENKGRKVTVTYNIGTYKAGTGVSIVPGEAEIECRFSVAPGETVEAVRKQVEEAIRSVSKDDLWLKENPPEISWLGRGIMGWLQDPEHPFVKTFKQSAEEIVGQPVPLGGMTAAADARFAPYFNLPALMCGASGTAHAINEFVDLDSVLLITKVIAAFIVDWCGVEIKG